MGGRDRFIHIAEVVAVFMVALDDVSRLPRLGACRFHDDLHGRGCLERAVRIRMGLAFHGDVALLPILGPVVGDIVVMVGYDLRVGPFDLSNIFVLGIGDV